ncbi:HAD family hydrolase [Sulfidibacter corallicola]|uniref:HAD family hydrolase n=1 Tax=Sulfidibacter corallicola TaxID=2818388 RepID=A0A8A4TZF1_SULCO|nr:HAD family hydrolase [Sulfidibacter corallicola]QTD54312.1 HAD family hydrolase [Sulfidibacter corallicola]
MSDPSLRRIKYVVFDCGGTLVDLVPEKWECAHTLLTQLDLDIPLPFIQQAYRTVEFAMPQKSSRERDAGDRVAYYDRFNRMICIQLGIESKWKRVNALFQKQFPKMVQWRVFSDTWLCLEDLFPKLPLYVLANWDRHLPRVLEKNKLSSYFRAAFASQDLGSEKPDPEIFRAFLQRVGIDAEACLYVGNEYLADVVGSRACGFHPVLVDRAGFYPDVADCIKVKDLSVLATMLTR